MLACSITIHIAVGNIIWLLLYHHRKRQTVVGSKLVLSVVIFPCSWRPRKI